MVKLTDSTRRFILFIVIVIGGSVLLLFDIPVIYLIFALIALACILLVITGAILLGDVISEMRYLLKNRKPKIKKQKPKKEPKKSKVPGGVSLFSRFSNLKLSGKPTGKKKDKGSVLSSFSKESLTSKKNDGKSGKKQKDDSADSLTPENERSDSSDPQKSMSKKKEMDIDDDLLDDFDIDMDLDSELNDMNPEDDFGNIRTPFAGGSVMEETSDMEKLDISTSEEDDDIIIDRNAVGDDDLDSIYSSALDTGSDSGSDILANMDGGDSLSITDISSYSSGDDSPYGYNEEDEGEEEQYELGGLGGGGDDDDLIASLKADINELKEQDDNCLLRDLKDIDVSAEQIQDELLDIINIITKKIKKR